jgi:myo-inositol-1(or 4)-monophosphatase
MTPQNTIRALAAHVRDSVIPHLGTWRARRVTGIASSGDATFSIDDIAEEAVEQFNKDNSLPVAYYSEDRGLVHIEGINNPEGVLIIDPIDGTRAAVANLESCVVSVAWCKYSPHPTLSDVAYAAIAEIKSGQTFAVERGNPVAVQAADGSPVETVMLTTTDVEKCAMTFGTVGAPLNLVVGAGGELASLTTVKGGFFILNSSAFELTRLVTGQLSAVVDIRNRVLKDFPSTRPQFERFGGGRLLSLYGYDVAAAAVIAQSAGCVVTDAWGNSLDKWDLMDTTESNFGSLIAASNAELHANILKIVNEGFNRFNPN